MPNASAVTAPLRSYTEPLGFSHPLTEFYRIIRQNVRETASLVDTSLMKMLLISLTLLPSLFQPHTSTQKKGKSKGRSFDARFSRQVPVVFGRRDDGFPERLEVHGVITELCFAGGKCGGNWESGTIKVKLLDNIEGYPHENVFVVVSCFYDPDFEEKKYLKKVVRLEVSKLYPNYNRSTEERPCYYEIITNTIKSRGTPFYCTRKGIREIIGRQGALEKSPD